MEKETNKTTKKEKVSTPKKTSEKTTKKVKSAKTKKSVEKVDKEKIKVEEKVIIPKKTRSTFKLSDLLLITGITLIVSFAVGVVVTLALTTKDTKKTELDAHLKEFVEQYNHIVDNYYEEVDKNKLIDGAISGMLDSLGDIHTSFIDKENSNLDQTLQGSYEGVGIEIYNNNNGDIVVSQVFDKSSAKDAGIKPGDIIVSVDNKDMRGKDITDFSSYVKNNNKKKNYIVQYSRNGELKTVTLKKKYVIIESVTSKIYEQNNKKVGYLNIDTFSATTYNQFKTKLEALEKENIDSLIIDLRDNTGGHLNVVTDMVSLLMDKSHIIYQIQIKDEIEKFYSKGNETKKYPIFVLQNSLSASASELMSSALKEQMNATIIGENSYGKGTVQELVDLSDGNQYKFTTKKWLTSDGHWINGVGVEADIKVELDEKYYDTRSENDDNQLQTAIMEASK